MNVFKQYSCIFFTSFLLFLFLTMPFGGNAEVLKSSSFQILDPVIAPGGYSTSDAYRLQSVIIQSAIGISVAESFNINAGFLSFPFVSTPAISATSGDGQASLSWTVAVGALGWTVGGYNIGQSTTSGGPYTYTSVGNVLLSTRTGLTNGTTYYFIVRPEDAFGNSIATSSQVSATPVAVAETPAPPGPSGGGGGGGGGILAPQTAVNFSGRAYPLSKVSVLKDGQLAITTIAGPDANFNVSLTGLSSGNYSFSVFGEDSQERRSTLFTFPIFISTGATTNIGGIFIAPTIGVDKSEVSRGEDIVIFGQSVPLGEVTISVHSDEELFTKVKTDEDGIYLYNFDTALLNMGQHFTKSKAAIDGDVSPFGGSVSFLVGTKTVLAKSIIAPIKGDLNGDGRVNLIDFSIVAYWYKRPLSAAFKPVEIERFNGDGQINLVDFSIMAFYWTG